MATIPPKATVPSWITSTMWIGRGKTLAMTIKEFIYIRVTNSTSNRNIGEYDLSVICDGVLPNTPRLKFKNQQEHQQQ